MKSIVMLIYIGEFDTIQGYNRYNKKHEDMLKS